MSTENETTEQIAKQIPTPRLGLAKGILMILFGFALAFEMTIGLGSNYLDNPNRTTALIGFAWLIIILGLFLWRGITAIVRRHSKRVSVFTVWGWSVVLAVMIVFLAFILSSR